MRELSAALGRVDLGGPPALAWFTPGLIAAAEAYSTVAYRPHATERGFELSILGLAYAGSRVHDAERCSRIIQAQVRSLGRFWGTYDPARPEHCQRNRVLSVPAPGSMIKQLRAMPRQFDPERSLTGLASFAEMFREVGWDRPHARVLVCDGPRLLAYVGLVSDDLRPSQIATLRGLVPALRRRLIAEERLGQGDLRQAALEAALETVGSAAFVLDQRGHIEHANLAGRRWFAADRAGVRAAIVARHEPTSQLEVTRFAAGEQRGELAILRAPPTDARQRIAAAARRWGLTPRQVEVLVLLARGFSNARIAAELGCAEATVEVHVSRILCLADVDSRSALIATLLWS